MNFRIKYLFSYPLALFIWESVWDMYQSIFTRSYHGTNQVLNFSDNTDLFMTIWTYFFVHMLQVYCRLTCNTSLHYCNTASHCCFLCDQRERKASVKRQDIIEVPVCHCHKSLEFTLDWPKSRCRAWDCCGRKYISFIGRVTREGISKEEEWIFWISNTMYYRCYGNSYMWTLLNIVVFCGGCLSLKLYFIGNIYIFQCFDHGTGF